MGKTLGCCIVAIMLLSSAPTTMAHDCLEFADVASATARQVREIGGCGLNLNDVSLSTSRSDQFGWCLSVSEYTAKIRQSELVMQAGYCSFCDKYAKAVTEAALENIKYGCALTDPRDKRWTPGYEYHLKGCMDGLQALRGGGAEAGAEQQIQRDLLALVGAMQIELAECKETHAPRPGLCKTCHAPQSTALLPSALRPGPKRGSSGHDFSVARQPPSIKQGTSSGDSDKAQPSGERRRTPSGGSSTSAMDRLGGGTSATPSGGAGSGGGSAARPSGGGGGASSAPAGGSSAPNIGTNTIMRPGGTSPGQGQSPGLR